jgi:hypothetical protein
MVNHYLPTPPFSYKLEVLISTMTFNPPNTYTAYAFTKAGGTLEKLTVDWKDPKAGEIIVKVLACGVCHRSVHSHRLDQG